MSDKKIKALIFDVFGTVVDWRKTITRRLNSFLPEDLSDSDLESFATEWRKGYSDYIKEFNDQNQTRKIVDEIHKNKLIKLLKDFKLIDKMNDHSIDKLNQIWHQLDPWEDSVEGLALLKNKFSIGTLSNGNFSLLLNMSKYSKLSWDFIFSGDIFLKYKPNEYVYKKATEYLGLETNEVMLVAAHENDLLAAEKSGLKTAYVHRPFEYSSNANYGKTLAGFSQSSNAIGCSVTGGYFYSKEDIPLIKDHYLFSDYCTGKIWGLKSNGTNYDMTDFSSIILKNIKKQLYISSFGIDSENNIYIINHTGEIYKIIN